MANGVGVIDSDYRGELCVAMLNLGDGVVTIRGGERIAQLALLPVCHALPTPVDSLEPTCAARAALAQPEPGACKEGIPMASKGKSQGLTGILLLLSGVILGLLCLGADKGRQGPVLAVLRQQLRHRLPHPLYR